MMRMQRITDDLNRVTREHLSGLRVIRAYNSQGFHGRRFEAANAELTGANTFVNNAFAFLMPSLTAIMSGLSLAIYVLGAVMIDAATGAERLTLFSQMIVFSAYALQIVGAFMMLAFVFIFMPRARVAWRRIREVLSTEPGIADGAARVGRSRASGEVEFRNVSFRYPRRRGRRPVAVLDDRHSCGRHDERGRRRDIHRLQAVAARADVSSCSPSTERGTAWASMASDMPRISAGVSPLPARAVRSPRARRRTRCRP